MHIRSKRALLANEMKNVILFHVSLYALITSVFVAHKHKTYTLAAITANTAIMGERVWAVQHRAMFVWHPWIQHVFKVSRFLVLGIYTGVAAVWGVHVAASQLRQ